MLFSIIFFSLNELKIKNFNFSNFLNLILFSSLILKIGIAPFHFWFPNVIEGLSWIINFLLITWQKIAPLIIISFTINFYFFIFIFFSSIIGAMGGLNQTSLRKLIAYSSINHLAWMLSAIINNEIIWINYFFFYSLISLSIILIFFKLSIFWINQIFTNFNFKKNSKLLIFIPLLSLGGLPPFLGFFPKWLVIENLLINNFFIILINLIFFTLITLFYYIRISFSLFLINYNKINFKNFNFLTKNLFNSSFFLKINLLLLINFFSLFGLLLFNLINF